MNSINQYRIVVQTLYPITMFKLFKKTAVREKCPYLELLWSAFSRIQTEYKEMLRRLLRKSPYLVQIQENMDQKKLRIWTLFT